MSNIRDTFACTFNNYRRTASSSLLLAWQGTLHNLAALLPCDWAALGLTLIP